jgi:hypothetical protein
VPVQGEGCASSRRETERLKERERGREREREREIERAEVTPGQDEAV